MSLKVASERCASCIFGPNSPLRHDTERMRELSEAWRAQDTHQICHAFGHGEVDDDGNEVLVGEEVVCRGFFDTQPHGQLLRIAGRINCIEFVDPPENDD